MTKRRAKQRRSIGQFLTELRRSHASGTHRKTRKDRANTKRRAVAQDRKDSG